VRIFLATLLAVISVTIVSPVTTQQLYVTPQYTKNPALAEFGLRGTDVNGPLYVVRTNRDLSFSAGVIVHAKEGRCYLVSGPRAALDDLRALQCQVIPIDDGTWPRPNIPEDWRRYVMAEPAIQAWVDQLEWSDLEPKIKKLVNFGTRYKQTPQHAAVAETLFAFFQGLGLDTELHTFTQPGGADRYMDAHNVVATQPGVVRPDSIVVLCAHYDSYSENYMVYAPGADDNATGVAAVQAAAEILSQHQFEYTIRYICFASEEYGGWGAGNYVRRAKMAGDKILGALNYDMIGFRSKGGDIRLEVEANEPSTWLGQAVVSAAQLYTNRKCRLHITDIGWSDNASFWRSGYAALNHEEEWEWDSPDFNPYWHTTSDVMTYVTPGWTTGNAKVAVASLAMLARPLHSPVTGLVAGRVVADCPADTTGLLGVVVDAYSTDDGDLAGSDTTNASGEYRFPDIDTGDYTVTIVAPLGYTIESEEIAATVRGGETTTADFVLECGGTASETRGIGYWKHQFAAALCGKGRGHIDAATLCDYLDQVELHFNDNPLNPIAVYQPPDSGGCTEKLRAAKTVLSLKANIKMPALANRHLMAVLLNVASGKLSPWKIVSKDGATVSQAVTYCDSLLEDANYWNDWVAQYITVCINVGWPVRSGIIPLDIVDIAYAPREGSDDAGVETQHRLSLDKVYPNPFNPSTTIHYTVPEAGLVELRIYDVTGRLVRPLVSEWRSQGGHASTWDGRDTRGAAAASGIYFVRLESDGRVSNRKIMLLK
jgi:hypothetical protein